MSKKNIGKKLLALAAIGAAIGGIIVFFKKFEKEDDDDFDFDSFEVPTGCECEPCDTERSRRYTTIAGEKEDSENTETTAAEEILAEEARVDEKDAKDAAPQDGQDETSSGTGEVQNNETETSDEEKKAENESTES